MYLWIYASTIYLYLYLWLWMYLSRTVVHSYVRSVGQKRKKMYSGASDDCDWDTKWKCAIWMVEKCKYAALISSSSSPLTDAMQFVLRERTAMWKSMADVEERMENCYTARAFPLFFPSFACYLCFLSDWEKFSHFLSGMGVCVWWWKLLRFLVWSFLYSFILDLIDRG